MIDAIAWIVTLSQQLSKDHRCFKALRGRLSETLMNLIVARPADRQRRFTVHRHGSACAFIGALNGRETRKNSET